MQPIYKEYVEFLNSYGLQEFLKENKIEWKDNTYWLDRQIIKGFDKDMKVHKILSIKIDNSELLHFKSYKKKVNYENMINYNEVIELNKDSVDLLEKESMELIKSSLEKYKHHKPIILTSGGKDSVVTLSLTRKVADNILGMFNNTSLDCGDTIKHIHKINNVITTNPTEGFYQWRDRLNFIPTRFSRACCTIFKEGNMIANLNNDDKHIFFMGMRNQESAGRSGYVDEWHNDKWSDNWMGILPIRKWTEFDIWIYMMMNNLDVNTKYKKGYTRVGCAIACPFYTKSTWILDNYWYPKMRKRWMDIIKDDFVKNKKWTIMNCTKKEYEEAWSGGMVRDEPTQEVILEFMEAMNLKDIEIAKKYFNKYCMNGCLNVKKNPYKLKKDEIAMNLKLYGRNIEQYKCKKCLMKDFNLTPKQYKEKVEQFKNSECDLF